MPPLRSRPTRREGAIAIARRVMRAAASDRISLTAAGCAFYATLALFPGIFLLVLVYGMAFDSATVEPQLEVLRELVPEETYDLIAGRLHELVSSPRPAMNWGAIVSGAVAIWSASAGTRAMLGALNMAHKVADPIAPIQESTPLAVDEGEAGLAGDDALEARRIGARRLCGVGRRRHGGGRLAHGQMVVATGKGRRVGGHLGRGRTARVSVAPSR